MCEKDNLSYAKFFANEVVTWDCAAKTCLHRYPGSASDCSTVVFKVFANCWQFRPIPKQYCSLKLVPCGAHPGPRVANRS